MHLYSRGMHGPWFGKPSTEQDFCKKKKGGGGGVVVVLMCPNLSGISNGSLENRKESNILNKIASTFT